jgi:transcriptional regulator with XRE-family HTH domain
VVGVTTVAARLLRQARDHAGLTQAELARRSGTSQSAISAYEAGRKDPTASTLARLLAGAGIRLAVERPPADMREFLRTNGAALPPRDTLVACGSRIARGEDASFVVREFLDGDALAERVVGSAAVPPLVADEPAATGDRRVDALLGGLAEHLALRHGFARPAWCVAPTRFLDAWWFPHARRAFDAIAVRDAPAAFRRRGVFLHPSSLERV